jgi:hypothetical protein
MKRVEPPEAAEAELVALEVLYSSPQDIWLVAAVFVLKAVMVELVDHYYHNNIGE